MLQSPLTGLSLSHQKSWRTLNEAEWYYLVNTRQVKGETGYGKTCMWAELENGVDGLIIFVDNYTGATTGFDAIPDGAVFLPAAGARVSMSVSFVGSGYYWSSTPYENRAYCVCFNSGNVNTNNDNRNNGNAVRLVR